MTRVSVTKSAIGLLLIIAIQLSLFAYSGVLPIAFDYDQHTYNAEVTYFLRDEPLDWQEIYYETGNPISDRFYMSYWTLAQSFVVSISGIHILQAQMVINAIMVPLIAATIYIFGRNLGYDSTTSAIYVLVSLFCYRLLTEQHQTGAEFFLRPIQDKLVVGYVLAPIALSTAYLYKAIQKRSQFVLYLLLFMSLMFTHVMMAAFLLVAVIVWCLLGVLPWRHFQRSALAVTVASLLLFSPGVLLRLTTNTNTYNYGREKVGNSLRVLVYQDSGLYTINPNAAGALTYVLLPLGILAAIYRHKEDRSLLFAAIAFTAVIGLIPITAWIYGKLLSTEAMVRVLWIVPYGYMLGFVLESGYIWLYKRVPGMCQDTRWLHKSIVVLPAAVFSILLTALLLGKYQNVDFSKDLTSVFRKKQDLLEIAQYLETAHDERVWILGSPDLRNMIPSLSERAITLSHYNDVRMISYSALPPERAAMQVQDNLRFYDYKVPLQEKLSILDKYEIDYLLYSQRYGNMMSRLFRWDAERFDFALRNSSVSLVRIN